MQLGQVSLHRVQTFRSGAGSAMQDVVEAETATPVSRAFVDALVAAPFFEPGAYPLSIVHPRAHVVQEPPSRRTRPFVVPAIDVCEDLRQFTHITVSLLGRVLPAALLLAFGMIKINLPIMLAGLLFLPCHHQILAMSLASA